MICSCCRKENYCTLGFAAERCFLPPNNNPAYFCSSILTSQQQPIERSALNYFVRYVTVRAVWARPNRVMANTYLLTVYQRARLPYISKWRMHMPDVKDELLESNRCCVGAIQRSTVKLRTLHTFVKAKLPSKLDT